MCAGPGSLADARDDDARDDDAQELSASAYTGRGTCRPHPKAVIASNGGLATRNSGETVLRWGKGVEKVDAWCKWELARWTRMRL